MFHQISVEIRLLIAGFALFCSYCVLLSGMLLGAAAYLMWVDSQAPLYAKLLVSSIAVLVLADGLVSAFVRLWRLIGG